MENMMWALVKDEAKEGITMKKVPIPELRFNDVKINPSLAKSSIVKGVLISP